MSNIEEVKIVQLGLERFDELIKTPGLFETPSENIEIRRKNIKDGFEICIIAEYNEKIIGEISVMLKNDNIPAAVIPNRRAYLYGFTVREELRGFGIGQLLLWESFRICIMRGYLEQTVAIERGGKKSLYEKAGFVPFLNNLNEKVDGNEIEFDLYIRHCQR